MFLPRRRAARPGHHSTGCLDPVCPGLPSRPLPCRVRGRWWIQAEAPSSAKMSQDLGGLGRGLHRPPLGRVGGREDQSPADLGSLMLVTTGSGSRERDPQIPLRVTVCPGPLPLLGNARSWRGRGVGPPPS